MKKKMGREWWIHEYSRWNNAVSLGSHRFILACWFIKQAICIFECIYREKRERERTRPHTKAVCVCAHEMRTLYGLIHFKWRAKARTASTEYFCLLVFDMVARGQVSSNGAGPASPMTSIKLQFASPFNSYGPISPWETDRTAKVYIEEKPDACSPYGK
jgi:hypothetical protein